MAKKNDRLLDDIINKYKIKDKEEFISIVWAIYDSYEFKKRLGSKYPHHGNMSLGEHILEVSAYTYKVGKKHINNDKFKLDIAVKIAMLHDLYVSPWQNSTKNKHICNYHGFRHPVEAVINAIYWYPELFSDTSDTEIIIDGIIHHMYPFPVRSFELDNSKVELNNYDLINRIDKKYIDIIIKSSRRGKIGKISFARSKYLEGRIMARSDKLVSLGQFNNIGDVMALVTARNSNLKG